MSKEEIARKISEFADYLNVANIFTDPFRWLGWVIVRGITAIVDGLEKVTDEILLIKKFFQNPEVLAFVDSIRPFLFILLALNLMYVGYLLIYQKKFDREGIAINLFIALAVVALLGTGMEKANKFTDEAIKAAKTDHLYETEDNASLSDTVIQRNVTDLVMFDKNGWSITELDSPNDFPPSKAKNIDIKQRFTKDNLNEVDIKLSRESEEISKHHLVLGEGGADKVSKFDQSGLEWNNEYYYRYHVDWFTLIVTLFVIGFTLFSIAYKLARLAFELTFNYVLAIIVAPVDIHDGQKTKKILQSILNTFIVIILIFLSMKVYTIGTSYIADQLSGWAFLIALIAFSVAVIDGPNIVERLFGIDAGLKSGWGVLAGAYAGAKMFSGTTKSLNHMVKNKGNKGNNTERNSINKGKSEVNSKGSGGGNAPSPNDSNNNSKCPKCGQSPCVCPPNIGGGSNTGGDKKKCLKCGQSPCTCPPNTGGGSGTGGTGSSIAQLAEEKPDNRRKQTKAPSPNGAERADLVSGGSSLSDLNSVQRANDVQKSTVQTDMDMTSVADQEQGSSSVHGIQTSNTPSPKIVSPTRAQVVSSGVGSETNQKTQGVQKSTTRMDSDITNVLEQPQEAMDVNSVQTGGEILPSIISPASTQNTSSGVQTGDSSEGVQRLRDVQRSTIRTDSEVENVTEYIPGNQTTSTTQTSSPSSTNATPTRASSGSTTVRDISESHSIDKTKVIQNSTMQSQIEVARSVEQVEEIRTGIDAISISSGGSPTIQNHSYERKRPKIYKLGSDSRNTIAKMKSFRKW